MPHDTYLRIIRAEDRSPLAAVARLGLRAAEPAYRAAVAWRNRAFDTGRRAAVPLGRPTVSVGNLTTGGTGKTPFVIALVHRLHEMGQHPAVLLRGYGDDETRELEHAVADLEPAVPVEANPDRAAQAADLLQRRPDVTVFVLDDAFQHRQAHRDLDLVLIDATQPFGGEHLLPRGLLREPMESLKRADAVLLTRCDQIEAAALSALDARIEALTGAPPMAHVVSTWQALRTEDETEIPAEALQGQAVLGACAIGNPQAFECQLRGTAGTLIEMVQRDDHHPWSRDELTELLQRAAAHEAAAVVTTDKDWVKWAPLLTDMGPDRPRMPIWRPRLAPRLRHGEAAFVTLLEQRLSGAA